MGRIISGGPGGRADQIHIVDLPRIDIHDPQTVPSARLTAALTGRSASDRHQKAAAKFFDAIPDDMSLLISAEVIFRG